MAATFYWTLSYGGTEKTVGAHPGATESGAGSNGNKNDGKLYRIDFLSADTGELINGTGNVINYYDHPIRAGNNSYERYVRFYFSFDTTTNKITGMKFWLSQGSATGYSCWLDGATVSTYTAPNTGSTIATNLVPLTEGTALDCTPAGGLTASGYSNYVVLQLRTNSDAPPGDIMLNDGNALQFTAQYDEQ